MSPPPTLEKERGAVSKMMKIPMIKDFIISSLFTEDLFA
jgi:hypothetical protein